MRALLSALLLSVVAVPPALPAQARAPLDSANARAATADYQRTGRARVVQSGTYTMVPFGHVQPTLRCAPLRVCRIELQRGEEVIDWVPGDPERWVVDFATGPDSVTVVVTKPVALPDGCDLTTNLVLMTTRRIYDVTLDSPPCSEQGESTNPDLPYTRQLKFYYPDDAFVMHRAPATSPAPQSLPAADTGTGPMMPLDDLSQLHTDYQILPDRRFPWTPKVVLDNGRQTCIRLPPQAGFSDMALLYEVNAAGGYELAQYVVRDGCILTDLVMLRMVLLIAGGERGDPLRLLIVRRPSRSPR
jgi:type IV secretory pathway VirB9-like protein